MKIGITFFGSKLDLLCISKVLTIFCVFSRIRRKRKHSRGHVACLPSARGDLCGLSGARRTRKNTREGSIGFGHSGHVSTRATSGGTLAARVLGTRVALGGFRVNITRWACGALGGFRGGLRRTRRLPGLLAAHSEASGVGSRLRHSGTGGTFRR